MIVSINAGFKSTYRDNWKMFDNQNSLPLTSVNGIMMRKQTALAKMPRV